MDRCPHLSRHQASDGPSEPRLDVALEKLTTEIDLGEVHIPHLADTLWLPLDVTVTAVCNGNFPIRHEYSKYRQFVVQSTISIRLEGKPYS